MPEIVSTPATFDLDLGVNAKIERPILVVDHECDLIASIGELKGELAFTMTCEHGTFTFPPDMIEFREST
jgi:hypothetical protein